MFKIKHLLSIILFSLTLCSNAYSAEQIPNSEIKNSRSISYLKTNTPSATEKKNVTTQRNLSSI